MLGFIVLVPLLVVGSWFVIITVMMGLVDGAVWVLDEGWTRIRVGKRPPAVKAVKVNLEFQTESRATS